MEVKLMSELYMRFCDPGIMTGIVGTELKGSLSRMHGRKIGDDLERSEDGRGSEVPMEQSKGG